jgi:hypothetical protein
MTTWALPRFQGFLIDGWSARNGRDPKVATGRLGHSSTRITQDLYQHRVEQLDRAAAEKVAGLIFVAGSTNRPP